MRKHARQSAHRLIAPSTNGLYAESVLTRISSPQQGEADLSTTALACLQSTASSARSSPAAGSRDGIGRLDRRHPRQVHPRQRLEDGPGCAGGTGPVVTAHSHRPLRRHAILHCGQGRPCHKVGCGIGSLYGSGVMPHILEASASHLDNGTRLRTQCPSRGRLPFLCRLRSWCVGSNSANGVGSHCCCAASGAQHRIRGRGAPSRRALRQRVDARFTAECRTTVG